MLSKELQNVAPKLCDFHGRSEISRSQRRNWPHRMMRSGCWTTKPRLISVPLSLLHCTLSFEPLVAIFGFGFKFWHFFVLGHHFQSYDVQSF